MRRVVTTTVDVQIAAQVRKADMSAEEKTRVKHRKDELKKQRLAALEHTIASIKAQPTVLECVLRAANDAFVLQDHLGALTLGRHLTRVVPQAPDPLNAARQVCINSAIVHVAEACAHQREAEYATAAREHTTAVRSMMLAGEQDMDIIQADEGVMACLATKDKAWEAKIQGKHRKQYVV